MKNSDALFTKVFVFVHADIEHFVVVVLHMQMKVNLSTSQLTK